MPGAMNDMLIEKLEAEVKFWQEVALDLLKQVMDGPTAISFARSFEIGEAIKAVRQKRREQS